MPTCPRPRPLLLRHKLPAVPRAGKGGASGTGGGSRGSARSGQKGPGKKDLRVPTRLREVSAGSRAAAWRSRLAPLEIKRQRVGGGRADTRRWSGKADEARNPLGWRLEAQRVKGPPANQCGAFDHRLPLVPYQYCQLCSQVPCLCLTVLFPAFHLQPHRDTLPQAWLLGSGRDGGCHLWVGALGPGSGRAPWFKRAPGARLPGPEGLRTARQYVTGHSAHT